VILEFELAGSLWAACSIYMTGTDDPPVHDNGLLEVVGEADRFLGFFAVAQGQSSAYHA
jgi:hypothetical protein